MANQDNPIFKVIDDVLGLQGSPRSFEDKIDRLEMLHSERMTYARNYKHYNKLDAFNSTLGGSYKATSQIEVKSLYQHLYNAGLVPEAAGSVFDSISRAGGSIFYNPKTNLLLFGNQGRRLASLPTKQGEGILYKGGLRATRGVLEDYSGATASSFIEQFYGLIQPMIGVNEPSLGQLFHAVTRQVPKYKINPRGSTLYGLLQTQTKRGFLNPDSAFLEANLINVSKGGGIGPSQTFVDKIAKVNRAYASAVKHAGKYLDRDILRENVGISSIEDYFKEIQRYRNEYISELSSFLKETGGISTYPFVKPEYMGGKKALLIASKMYSDIYGSMFEEHALSKGLFQVRRMAATTTSQVSRIASMGRNPFNPFLTSGAFKEDSFALRREIGFKVAVVDTTDNLTSTILFNEGGGFLTESGQKMFARQTHMGTIKVNTKEEATIKAAEKVFGINLGITDNINLGGATALSFNRLDYDVASRKDIADSVLSPLQSDLRRLLKASGKYSGVWQQVAESQGKLLNIQLTDSGLKLDFATQGDVILPEVEAILGTRRMTLGVAGETHRLKSMISSLGMQGVDAVIPASEFAKTHGTRVYLQNFVTEIGKTRDAHNTFKRAFKDNVSFEIAHAGKRKYKIPIITDVNSAYEQAKQVVSDWKIKGTIKQQELAARIEHGVDVTNTAWAQLGVKGVRVYNIGGAFRADYMDDINMMKPIRITPSKMVTLATAGRQLGYKTTYADPLIRLLSNQNYAWRKRLIYLGRNSGQLGIDNAHPVKQFAMSLLGTSKIGVKNKISNVIELHDDGFYHMGKRLKRLPAAMSEFSYNAGGVALDDLKGTILDPSLGDISFIKLKNKQKLSLVPKDSREYEYLPIPRKYLRTGMGVDDRSVISKTDPAYRLIESFIDLEQGKNIENIEGKLSEGYMSVTRSLSGRKGLFNVGNTILINSGSRARLVPSLSGYHNVDNYFDENKIFDAVIGRSQFEDYLVRKSGIGSANVTKLKEIADKEGFLYGMISVDPMQRAEHAGVFRIRIKDDKTLPQTKIGQILLEMHAAVFRMFERDTDKDAANIVFLEGLKHDGNNTYLRKMLEDRVKKQEKLSKHFLWFYRLEQVTKKSETSVNRLSNIVTVAADAMETLLGKFIGTPKSVGYSILRASDKLMPVLVNDGMEGVKAMGLIDNEFLTEEIIDAIRKPYVNDSIRLSVSQKLTQNFMQGAVQKGSGQKGDLLTFGERLVGIGQKYKGGNFDYEKIVNEAAEASYDFLKTSAKERHFMGLDYLYDEGFLSSVPGMPDIDRTTVDLVKADVERAAKGMALDNAAEARIKQFTDRYLRGAARLLGENLGPGMVVAASVKRMPSFVQQVIQNVNVEEGSEFSKVLRPLLGAKAKLSTGIGTTVQQESLANQFSKKISDAQKGSTRAILDNLGDFFKTDAGHFFAGLGVGALGAAALFGLASGPEAPMPRDIDTRQPTDLGPVVYSSPPKIYGTNQNFYASKRRSPESFSPVNNYNFGVEGNSSVTIRDKRSPNNPYLLEQQIRQLAKSDYTY